ncbi:hypothetical protein [Streptomyces sp. NPDC048644]|uniref:hypothetical protein n=1 Tax=Streptomyces sp. NPDC048644 TaxID=3365582 RepID=UPI00371D7FC9
MPYATVHSVDVRPSHGPGTRPPHRLLRAVAALVLLAALFPAQSTAAWAAVTRLPTTTTTPGAHNDVPLCC